MSRADLRAYMERWKLVAEAERAEQARATPAQKFADTAMLMDVAWSLGGSTHTEEQVEEVRRRWILLAERLGG